MTRVRPARGGLIHLKGWRIVMLGLPGGLIQLHDWRNVLSGLLGGLIQHCYWCEFFVDMRFLRYGLIQLQYWLIKL